jgi:16S rRNA (guanine527-N7)-methyltransferase
MQQESVALLEEGLRHFGVAPSPDMVTAMMRHLVMVADWNERVNLTAITQEREMVVKHAIDSATVLSVVSLDPGMRILDVGTGAGFPGVVLKCILPAVRVVLLESLAKRCKFLEAVGSEVLTPLAGPAGFEVVWGRAEDLGQKQGFRESFDVVFARAVADMRVLSEYCLPFVKVGGSFVAMKGPIVAGELAGAAKAIALLGGEVAGVREVELPEGAGSRTLIRVEKVKATPNSYPRKAGSPAKDPL